MHHDLENAVTVSMEGEIKSSLLSYGKESSPYSLFVPRNKLTLLFSVII